MGKLFNLARMTTATTGTGNITLGAAVSGYLTFAGAGVANGDVVSYAIKDGANSEIGIATYSSTGPALNSRTVTKSTNANTAISLSGTAEVFITPRATDLVNQTTPGSQLYNASLAVSAASSALTIALKDALGADPSADSPVVVDFRSNTGTTGTNSGVVTTAATSIVIPSTATMGVVSATGFRLWVLQFSDGQLGVTNCTKRSPAQIFPLLEWVPATTTAISSGSSSAGVIYTTTAIVTAKSYRILGFIEWNATGLTAGTWTTTNLLTVQLYGPGIKKPGDAVQMQFTPITADTINTSTTYTATAATASFSPSSAANPLVVRVDGGAFFNGAQNVAMYAKLGRNSSANKVGSVCVAYSNNTGIVISTMYIAGFDFPNTTASTTYTVYTRNETGASNLYFPRDQENTLDTRTTIEIVELMG